MNTPLVTLKNVKKYFPIYRGFFRHVEGHIKAVDDVSFSIQRQEVHALVGESGSGKSTVGRLIIDLLKPTAGEILFNGESSLKLSGESLKRHRRRFQMIFQDPFASLNPRHTIEESLGEGLILHGLVKNDEEKKERIRQVLYQVGLSPEALKRYPHQFSGGQQQRICIARAVILEPEMIVCDEAVSALDVSIQAQILNLLSELQREQLLSYLFISHDLSVVQHISDWVTVMYLGKVMETGPAASIFNNPKHPYTQALLSSIPKKRPDEIKSRIILKGEIPSPSDPPSGCPFRTRCPFARAICAEPPPRKRAGEGHLYDCILD